MKQFAFLQKVPKYPFPIRGVANTAELTAITNILKTDPFSKLQMEAEDQTVLQAKAEWQLSPPLAYQLSTQALVTGWTAGALSGPEHCMWVGDLHLSPCASSAEGRNELRMHPGAQFYQQRVIPCHGEPCRSSYPVIEHKETQ